MLWTLTELCLDCNPARQWTLVNSKNKIWLASDGRMMNSCSEKLYLCGITTRAAHFYCAQLSARSYWTKECFGSLFYSAAQCSALRPNHPENMWINLNAARLDRIQSTLSTDATGESEIYQSFKVLVVVAVRLRSLSVRCFRLFASFLSPSRIKDRLQNQA